MDTMAPDMMVPVAFTIDAVAFARRGDEVGDLFAYVEAVEMLPDGYALRFHHTRETVLALGKFVAAENECRPFFAYEIAREMFVARSGVVKGS